MRGKTKWGGGGIEGISRGEGIRWLQVKKGGPRMAFSSFGKSRGRGEGLRWYQAVRGKGGGEGFKGMAELECEKHKGLCRDWFSVF